MKLMTNIVLVMLALSGFVTSSEAATTLFFDFGDGAQTTPGNYNNIITSVPQTLSVTNAIDSTGAATEIDLTAEGFSVGADTAGTTAPVGAAAVFDPQATRDNAFGQCGEFCAAEELDIQGLNPNMVYDFTFFTSRLGTSDNLEMKFTVMGQGTTDVVFLDASNNTSNVAVVSNVRPGVTGSILVNIEPGPNNSSAGRFFYLGALRLDCVPEPMSCMLVLFGVSFLMLCRTCYAARKRF